MTTRYEMELPVKLTDEEILEKAHELAEKANQARDWEKQIADVKAEMKKEIKRLESELMTCTDTVSELAWQIIRGEEDRPVMVREDFADDMSKVIIRREDTQEIVDTRPVSEEDRQMDLMGETATEISQGEASEFLGELNERANPTN
jgi:hypothetical protein